MSDRRPDTNPYAPPSHVRPIAIGIVRNGERVLVEHGFDSARNHHFFRPPGGEIEFGERAAEALRREFREEFDAELVEPRLVTVVENLFDLEGLPGHEVVFVFQARFADPELYEREEFAISETGFDSVASWKTLEELGGAERPLYPDGLLDIIAGESSDRHGPTS